MVYSQICSWVDDYLLGDAPEELLDPWDFMEWIQETELISVFTEYIIPTFSSSRARDHAVQILMALLWEYYLFRRSEAVVGPVGLEHILRLKAAPSVAQKSDVWYSEKQNLLTASEFAHIVGTGPRYRGVVRSKLKVPAPTTPIPVSLGHRDSLSWGNRFEPVIKRIYEQFVAFASVMELGRIRHATLARLGASPDGIVEMGERQGRLLEIKAPVSRKLEKDIIPYDYYCQVQVQMEVCDIELADYCECRIVSGPTWSPSVASSGPRVVGCVGVVQVEGVWSYVYSPLYSDDEEGRAAATSWNPEGLVEKHVWQIIDWQLITFKRNRRWWSMVGLPAYEQFWRTVDTAREDPLYFMPEEV